MIIGQTVQTGIFSLKGAAPAPVSTQRKDTASRNERTQIKELPSFYYQPVSFTGRKNRTYSSDKKKLREIPSKFAITKFDNVPCPACGKKMFTRSKFEKLRGELNEAESDKYIEILDKYTDYMRPVEESAYTDIKNLSEETGETDIRTVVEMLRNTKLKELQQVQTGQVRKMFELARTLTPEERDMLTHKAKELMRLIRRNRTETPFRRKIMIDEISQLEFSDREKQKELVEIAKAFPTSKDMNSAWIVKYSGMNKQQQPWESKDIALRLLEFSVPNTDHILAYSLERNNDDISNYMAMHSGCNTHKSDKTFMDWFSEAPEQYTENMQEYFDSVDTLISTRKLRKKKYKHYVAYATDTIKRVSDGQVDLTGKKTEEKK